MPSFYIIFPAHLLLLVPLPISLQVGNLGSLKTPAAIGAPLGPAQLMPGLNAAAVELMPAWEVDIASFVQADAAQGVDVGAGGEIRARANPILEPNPDIAGQIL